MKRTSIGLSLVLATLAAGCAPEPVTSDSGDSDMASPAVPAAARFLITNGAVHQRRIHRRRLAVGGRPGGPDPKVT